MHNQCPREVLTFLMDLLKYSDNQANKVATHTFHTHVPHTRSTQNVLEIYPNFEFQDCLYCSSGVF